MTNIDVFMQTLPIMLYGMAGIFAVMLLIFACIKIMNRVTGKKANKPPEQESE